MEKKDQQEWMTNGRSAGQFVELPKINPFQTSFVETVCLMQGREISTSRQDTGDESSHAARYGMFFSGPYPS